MSTEVKNLRENYLASNENDKLLDYICTHTYTHTYIQIQRDTRIQRHTDAHAHTQTHNSSSANVDQSLFIILCFLYDLYLEEQHGKEAL